MSYRIYTFGIFVAAILSWASWGVVVAKLSPFTNPQTALALFYSSFFVALTATFTLINYYARLTFREHPLRKSPLNAALRQGLLLSTMLTIGLAFQRLRVLTWWNGILLVLVIVLLEFYFGSRDD